MPVLSPREIASLYNSLSIALITAFCTTLIGVPLAFLWHERSFRHLAYFRYLLFFPLFIPPFIHALTLNNLLVLGTQLHIISFFPHVAAFRSIPGIVLILTIAYFPLTLLLVVNSIRSIPQQLIDSAYISGKPTQVLRRVLLPLIAPGIATSFLLTFIFAFITFDVPDYYNVPSFGTEIFSSFSAFFNTKHALLLSLIPICITALLFVIMVRFMIRDKAFYTPIASSNLEVEITDKRLKAAAWILYSCVMLLAVFIPIISLMVNGNIFSPVVRHAMYSSRTIIADTFWVSMIGGFTTVLAALPLYWYVYRKMMGRTLLLSFYSIPAITYAILSIIVFNQPSFSHLYASTFMLILVYTLRFMPIVCEIIHMHFSSINPQLLEAARLVAPNNTLMIQKVLWPLSRPALFLGWAVGFWLIASELPITLLIQPPGFQTVTSRIFIFIHYGSQDFTNTLTLILAILCLIPVALVGIVLKYDKTHYT